jgi:hypothetical protein
MNSSILVEVKDDLKASWNLSLARVPALSELIRIGKVIYTVQQVMFTPYDGIHCTKLLVSRRRQAGPND